MIRAHVHWPQGENSIDMDLDFPARPAVGDKIAMQDETEYDVRHVIWMPFSEEWDMYVVIGR